MREFVGDGVCDDLNNNVACGFDGKDCCQDNNISHSINATKEALRFSICQDCYCYEPENGDCNLEDQLLGTND